MHLHEREMYSFHHTRFNAVMIEISPNPMSIAKIRVKTPACVVLSAIYPFRAVNVVTRSILIVLDNRCVKSPPLIVLITKCAFTRMRGEHSIAKRRVKTPAFVVLSAIYPFRAVNDCNSFNIDRIGQPMC